MVSLPLISLKRITRARKVAINSHHEFSTHHRMKWLVLAVVAAALAVLLVDG